MESMLYLQNNINIKFVIVTVLPNKFLATDSEVQIRFPAIPDFLKSNGSGTGSTEPR
jgi:hypothetical protein